MSIKTFGNVCKHCHRTYVGGSIQDNCCSYCPRKLDVCVTCKKSYTDWRFWPECPECIRSKQKPEKTHNRMGDIGRQLCYLYDAWVVGSGVKFLTSVHHDAIPYDIDYVVPLDRWVEACKLIPSGSKTNSFGGAKFTDTNGITADVWAEDVVRILATAQKNGRAYQPKYGKLITIDSIS